MPFILRGVNLLGIDTVQVDRASRIAMWGRIATDLKPTWLDSQESTVLGLGDLAPKLDSILKGDVQGRLLVDPNR
jgi:hypothetical protein